jgi:hypothetical protein
MIDWSAHKVREPNTLTSRLSFAFPTSWFEQVMGVNTFLQAMPTRPRAAPYEHLKFGACAHGHSGEEAAAIPWPLPRALRARGGRAAPGVLMKLATTPRIRRTSCGYRKARHPRRWPRRRWTHLQPRAAVGSTACLAEPARHLGRRHDAARRCRHVPAFQLYLSGWLPVPASSAASNTQAPTPKARRARCGGLVVCAEQMIALPARHIGGHCGA